MPGAIRGAATGLDKYADIIVKAALAEDVGTGDITTAAVVSPDAVGKAELIAKENMVVAGLFVAEKVFERLDKSVVFKAGCNDGEAIKKGSVIATVSGSLSAMLSAERVALNFLQRLSGIATLTNAFVKETWSARARILDTRKTTPCLRILERYAVRAGGGCNHRFGLFDCILIKDNHIKAAGGIGQAVSMVNKKYGESAAIEVEVTAMEEVRQAIEAGADIIMLDNMAPSQMKKAVKLIGGLALTEASGGITLKNAGIAAASGVDFISIGGLTHSARAVDISMEVVSYAGKRKRGT
ncbi:carboxylating nicotinate-nucleotide diphosphorylase [bacterium]|nr:MAG: carboxylating nicotinate-nucleotide diphosphorylase [bacterium]